MKVENRTPRRLKISVEVDSSYQLTVNPGQTIEIQVPILKVVISE